MNAYNIIKLLNEKYKITVKQLKNVAFWGSLKWAENTHGNIRYKNEDNETRLSSCTKETMKNRDMKITLKSNILKIKNLLERKIAIETLCKSKNS